MSVIDFGAMRSELARDEGRKPWVYQDSMGFWTIGVGHLVDHRKNGQLPDSIIDALLNYDINDKLQAIWATSWFKACDTDPRRRVLVNLCFQIGVHGLESFSTFLGLVSAGKWHEAAADLRTTALYKECPERTERHCVVLENGS